MGFLNASTKLVCYTMRYSRDTEIICFFYKQSSSLVVVYTCDVVI